MKRRIFSKVKPLLTLCTFIWCAGNIFLLSSCGAENDPPVPVTKMSNILFDLQAAEDYSIGKFSDTTVPHGADKNPDTLAYYYAMVLQHHQLSVEQLQKAMDWYYAHPEMMDSVYKHVITKAEKYKGANVPQVAPRPVDTAATENAADSIAGVAPPGGPANMPKPADRPERTDLEPADRREDEDMKDIRQKNKDIKETLDKVKKQAQ